MKNSDEDRPVGADPRSVSGTPIARLLPLVLAGLVLFAALPVLLVGYLGAADNTGRLLRDRGEIIIDNMIDRIATHLEPPQQQLRYIQQAVATGAVDPESSDAGGFATFVLGTLAATPQVTGIGHIRPDRSLHLHRRKDLLHRPEDPGRISGIDRILAAARASPEIRWSSATWSPILKETVLVLVAPLRGPDGEFQGAVVAAMTVSALSRYLKDLHDQGGPMAFILVGRDRVVAHPHMAAREVTTDRRDGDPLPPIDAIGDPVLAAMWTSDRNPLSALAPFRQADGHWTLVGGESYAYVYRTVTGYGREPWTVGVYFPGVESRRERWTVQGIAIGGGALLCVALAAAVIIGRRLGRPILGLASVAERIEALEFGSVRDIPRGPIREVNWAASAFERMAAGLRLFETYVPGPVARALIASSGTLPPEVRTGTVLFADIEKFTTIAESMPPPQVVEMLNAYFGTVAEIIGSKGGVINQFQGDAILATFNIPVPEPDHARIAVQAALDIQDAVGQRSFAGQRLGVRIGINTGRIVGGSVGASGRLNYTVHGDAVNLAARLETLNKEHGTRILLTETTVAHAGLDDRVQRVGTLTVRGRSTPVTLFTIEPPKGERAGLTAPP